MSISSGVKEADIRDRIAFIESKMQHDSITLKQEKEFMAEIKAGRGEEQAGSRKGQVETTRMIPEWPTAQREICIEQRKR